MLLKERWIGKIYLEYLHSGLRLSKNGEWQFYIGYSQKEALRLFRAYLKEN
jgi:hypothetical protein